jgi:hypothetical protein
MSVTEDAIANAVLQQFDKLPQRRKPQDRGNGLREWVPLSGIVAQGTKLSIRDTTHPFHILLWLSYIEANLIFAVGENSLQCISLGYGHYPSCSLPSL